MKKFLSRAWQCASRGALLAAVASAGLVVVGQAQAQCSNGYRMIVTGGAAIVPGTVDIGNHVDDGTTAIALPFPFTFYGVSYSAAVISSNGNMQFTTNSNTLTVVCLPNAVIGAAICAYQADLYTVDTANGQGIFSSVTGAAPSRIFNLEWRTRFCCAGGSPTENFEIRLYENSSRIDIIYGTTSNNGAYGTSGIQATGIGPFNQFSCGAANMPAGTMVSFNTCPLDSEYACSDYRLRSTNDGVIVPGTTDTGNHCDDCATKVDLPFFYTIYDKTFDAIFVSSNGNVQFGGSSGYLADFCLPYAIGAGPDRAIMGYWGDLRTDSPGSGIFTSISGTAPNRVFNIEWRATYFSGSIPGTANFEIRLFENQRRWEVNYGSIGDSGLHEVVGMQSGHTGPALSHECFTAGTVSAGQRIEFACATCQQYSETSGTGATIVPGTTDIGIHCDDCIATIALPFPVLVHDAYFNSANVSTNGNIQFASASTAFTNQCLPTTGMNMLVSPYWDDLLTTSAGEGVFTSTSGAAPNRIFNVEWRAHHISGIGAMNFEARFYEGQSRIDFIYGNIPVGATGATGTIGIQRDSGFAYTQHSCSGPIPVAGTRLTYICAACVGYTAVNSAAAIVPGNSDTGNHCDDCTTSIALPFTVRVYDELFNTVNVESNGKLTFVAAESDFTNTCLPDAFHDTTLFVHWDDLRTDGTGDGIFTSVSGTAPNRIFNIEWRVSYFSFFGSANFEARLFENQDRFEFIYGALSGGGASATVGIQRDTGTYSNSARCNSSIANGSRIILACCKADFNMDGILNTQDIFDFLSAWFANDPRADFNGINGQNVQDIFDYLGVWFAGCT